MNFDIIDVLPLGLANDLIYIFKYIIIFSILLLLTVDYKRDEKYDKYIDAKKMDGYTPLIYLLIIILFQFTKYIFKFSNITLWLENDASSTWVHIIEILLLILSMYFLYQSYVYGKRHIDEKEDKQDYFINTYRLLKKIEISVLLIYIVNNIPASSIIISIVIYAYSLFLAVYIIIFIQQRFDPKRSDFFSNMYTFLPGLILLTTVFVQNEFRISHLYGIKEPYAARELGNYQSLQLIKVFENQFEPYEVEPMIVHTMNRKHYIDYFDDGHKTLIHINEFKSINIDYDKYIGLKWTHVLPYDMYNTDEDIEHSKLYNYGYIASITLKIGFCFLLLFVFYISFEVQMLEL